MGLAATAGGSATVNHGSADNAAPHYLGHRRRLRQRFRRALGDGFHDYELLELLLTYAMPRRDVKPLSKELVARFHGLAGTL
ncbi:MAG: hypothetical protein NTU41_01090, partial [Chloroflexi bacterium]|nr:hypothetical protein [Chloroflexota bacterium]